MLVFGCASDPTALSKNFAQAKDFLAAHPNASVTVTVFKTADFDADQNFWDAQCDLNVSDIDLFKAVYEDANDRLTFLFSKDGVTVVCQFTEQLDVVPPDQNTADQNSPVPDLNAPAPDQNEGRIACGLTWDCTAWSACAASLQTRDCTLKPHCLDDQNRPAISRSCIMPVGSTCAQLNGSICSAIQKCTNILDANDAIDCCANCVAKTCTEQSGSICDANHSCSVSNITTADTNSCCTGTCTAINPCASVSCDSNKTCVAGTCVQKTCSQLSGSVCASGTVCSTATVDSNGASACCTGTCQAPTCSQHGGTICTASQTCIVDYIPQLGLNYTPDTNGWYSASDSALCCDLNRSEVFGCASGDMSLAGPATWGPAALSGNELRVENFVVNYAFSVPDSNNLGVTMVPVQLYVDDVLDSGYTEVLAHSNGTLTSFGNTFDSNTHILYYATDTNLVGHTVRFVLDPTGKFLESDESNNDFNGTVQSQS